MGEREREREVGIDLSGEQRSLVGSVIDGRFKILARVAAGGMGVVYRAEQMPLGRTVAFKVLQSDATNDENSGNFRSRFFLEAAASARLNHPNIVTVFDYGAANESLLYIAMEFLDGRTLQKELTAGPMAPMRALRIALQICSGLREAHTAGMVHRDLKPGNVMLQARGAEGDFVKILDFGFVKLSDAPVELDLTHTGAILGSPRFMSPEQVQSQKVDHRSDIYSFGAVLYNMLAGKPPFNRGASFNILAAHINDAPPPLREYNPLCEASPRLEHLVQWCLAKTPDGRPPSMDAVLAEIQECFDELGLSTATLMSLAAAGAAAGFSTRSSMTGMQRIPTGVALPAAIGTGAYGTASESSLTAAPAAPRGRPPLGLLLGGTLLLALVGGIGGSVLVRGSGRANTTATPSAAPAGSSHGLPSALGATARPGASSGASASATGGAYTAVRLLSVPAGAHVRRAGRDLGDTPLPLMIPVGAEWTVEVFAPGYQPRSLVVAAGQGELSVRLDAATSAPPTAPQASAPTAQPSATAGARRGGSNGTRTPSNNNGTRRPTTDNRDPWAD